MRKCLTHDLSFSQFSLFSLSCLSVQELFFIPFAARGKVLWEMGRESKFTKTPKSPQPHPKGPEWLSTQDCPQKKRKRGKMGADLDFSICVCAGGQGVGCMYIHVFECAGISCLTVHPGPVY